MENDIWKLTGQIVFATLANMYLLEIVNYAKTTKKIIIV